jgi:hypothetical protein
MTHRTFGRAELGRDAIRCNALGTLVLWPSAFAEIDATRATAAPWPVFAVVVGTNPAGDAEPPRAPLDLLEVPRSPIDTIANSRCGWSISDPDQAMLRFAVRVVQPACVALDEPAEHLCGAQCRA